MASLKSNRPALETCFACLTMANRLLTKGSYSRFIASTQNMKNSAKSCPVCRMITEALRERDMSLFKEADEYESGTGLSYNPDGGTDIEGSRNKKVSVTLKAELQNVVHEVLDSENNQSCTYLQLSAAFVFGRAQRLRHGESKKEIRASLLAFPSQDSDTRLTGEGKFALITSWLASKSPRKPIFRSDTLPRRLLDVSDACIVRLLDIDEVIVKTSELNKIRYAALSHRWGASQHLVTTMASLNVLRFGIPVEQLPLTFQDAVLCCQNLAIPYLWIDALSIIQDSAEDWERESRKMGKTFQNAEVTIAVHCAHDDSEGFLLESLSLPKTVTCGEHLQLSKLSDHTRDITRSRLSRRGWVLQERLMSSRTIHFASGHIYFEDHEGIVDENDFVQSQDPEHHTTPSTRQLRKMFGFTTEHASNFHFLEQIDETLSNWLHLVEIYSQCELTKDSDKLIAIAGMTHHAQSNIYSKAKQHWCAGIWADMICHGLLWFSTTEGLVAPTDYQAPSWSWAAWTGAVQYPKDVVGDKFEPKCIFVSLKKPNESEVTWLEGPGILTLVGTVVELKDLYFGDAIQVGPGPARRGLLTESYIGLPRMDLRGSAHALWIRNLEGERTGWIVLDQVDKKMVRDHSISGNFDATERMEKYSEQFRPEDLSKYYFILLGSSPPHRSLDTPQPEKETKVTGGPSGPLSQSSSVLSSSPIRLLDDLEDKIKFWKNEKSGQSFNPVRPQLQQQSSQSENIQSKTSAESIRDRRLSTESELLGDFNFPWKSNLFGDDQESSDTIDVTEEQTASSGSSLYAVSERGRESVLSDSNELLDSESKYAGRLTTNFGIFVVRSVQDDCFRRIGFGQLATMTGSWQKIRLV